MKQAYLRTTVFSLMLTVAAYIFAQTPLQTYLVGEVSKSVILYQGNKKLAVTPGDVLPLGAVLTIPEKGRLVVYDEGKLRQYTILQAGTHSLAEFLNGSRKKSVPKVAFEGIIKLITSGDELPGAYATIDREIRTDSITYVTPTDSVSTSK